MSPNPGASIWTSSAGRVGVATTCTPAGRVACPQYTGGRSAGEGGGHSQIPGTNSVPSALVAFSANRGKSLSDISLPAIEDTPGAAEGFVGPEQMAVVESAFARRFRIQADGRTRQLQYRLTQGEAGWRLRHERTDEF